jgi:hypothetical protein
LNYGQPVQSLDPLLTKRLAELSLEYSRIPGNAGNAKKQVTEEAIH